MPQNQQSRWTSTCNILKSQNGCKNLWYTKIKNLNTTSVFKKKTKNKKPYTCILKLEGRIFQPVRRNLPSNAFQTVLKIYKNATSSDWHQGRQKVTSWVSNKNFMVGGWKWQKGILALVRAAKDVFLPLGFTYLCELSSSAYDSR